MAPFYFKLGESLANYIMLNTDELGNLKAPEVEDSDGDEPSAENENDSKEEQKEE